MNKYKDADIIVILKGGLGNRLHTLYSCNYLTLKYGIIFKYFWSDDGCFESKLRFDHLFYFNNFKIIYDFLFLEKCKKNFELIFIKEIPTINNPDTSVTFTISQDLRLEFAIDLIAAINIAAKCKILITHSGNCGYWAALYRGYSSGLVQHFTNEKGNNYGWILN